MTQALTRKLSEADLAALYRIRQIAFLDNISPTSAEAQAWHRATLPYKYGRFVDEALVACVSWYPYTMHLGGRAQTVAGLASVVSAAASRRKGHIRALLAHGLGKLRDDGISWCLEYPFDTRYYRRFGWETVSNGLFFEVPIARFAEFNSPPDVTRLEAGDAAVARLEAIYGRWALAYNFTMRRDRKIRDEWANLFCGVPWETTSPRFIFAMDEAYCVLDLREVDGVTKLTVRDYAFANPKGRADLLCFFNHFAGQADLVRIQLPNDDPLVLEWSNFMVAHPHPLQARVVDAGGALSGWTCSKGVDFTVEVVDDFCTWNQAVFRVEAEAGGVTRARQTDQPAQLTLDVRALARILSGSVGASAAARAGLVEGRVDAIAELCSLSRRASYMSMADYF